MKQFKRYIIIDKVSNTVLHTDDLDRYLDLERLYLLKVLRSDKYDYEFYNHKRMLVIKYA